MLRQVYQQASRSHTRALRYPTSSQSHAGARRQTHVIASSIAVTAGVLWYLKTNVVYGDAPAEERINKAREDLTYGLAENGTLSAFSWGSNKSNVISPSKIGVDSIRTPQVQTWLQDIALRDLALHERHAVCVDARGDIYRWGDGFFGDTESSSTRSLTDRKPILTLSGKNIVAIQLTDSRVFALSASGKVYSLEGNYAKQKTMPAGPVPTSSTWYRPGWLLGRQDLLDFVEITPNSSFTWGEKFVSIAAGSDHLLALTSSGRTFACPLTKLGNSHGQLGFRKFDVQIPSSRVTNGSPSSTKRMSVELTPKSILDPYSKATTFSRTNSSPAAPIVATPDPLALIDDQSIRFCDKLFEIPGLKGIDIAQVAAGGRTSFARTDTGRVLGWGSNDSGQIGLGGNVTLDTITVPTEVVLWRSVSNKTRSKCLGVCTGGDLTCFSVERINETGVSTVDLLMCGNGRWGGLGNNLFSSSNGEPVRARGISGLLEFNEKDQRLEPILPHSVTVSPTGHVLVTLDTHTRAGPGGGGRDLFVWGNNQQYEIGNGKRSSLAVPTTLQQPDGTRLMLMNVTNATVKDMQRKVWQKGVKVEQCAAAGYGNTILYWKIC